jgi:hypothetical protein
MPIQAFISCRFQPDETVDHICKMLQPEVVPYLATDVKEGSLPHRLREKIAAADCLIAILTQAGSSAFIQNEMGIAFALHKPIFAIYEDSVDVSGIQPFLSTFIKYSASDLARVAREVLSLKEAIATAVASREIAGSSEELLESLNRNGVLGIYPDRSTAFRVFIALWNREQDLRIVGSSIEGFKRGIGIEARELLMAKLNTDPKASVRILLTHASFAKYRESQENEIDGYIEAQIRATSTMLEHVRDSTSAKDRLDWRFFKGAPTCFMIAAGSFMLLNPYLYMQPAYFNFSLIAKDTKSPFDIYNHYMQYHFQRAWDDSNLSTPDGGLSDVRSVVVRNPSNQTM